MKNESQVKVLFDFLMGGSKIDRVQAFKYLGIADLRSRICNVETIYGVDIDRRTKDGVRYKEYWVNRTLK